MQKKICLLGAFAVGKTSLVSRFVKGLFSEKYLTTIGVKIDKKSLSVIGTAVDLIIWDLAGEDAFQKVKPSYLQGSAGYILVADMTRKATLDRAIQIRKDIEPTVGDIPFMLFLNKADLQDEYDIQTQIPAKLRQEGWEIIETSAKSGTGVERGFISLTRKILEQT